MVCCGVKRWGIHNPDGCPRDQKPIHSMPSQVGFGYDFAETLVDEVPAVFHRILKPNQQSVGYAIFVVLNCFYNAI